MLRSLNVFALAAAVVLASGCHKSSNNIGVTHSDGGTDGGNPLEHGDMAGPADAGPTPEPTTKLVSPMGAAAGLVTSADGKHALYLASPQPAGAPSQTSNGTPAYGTLHVTDSTGADATVGSGPVAFGGYTFSPDGTKIIYAVTSSAGQYTAADLEVASVSAPGTATKLVSDQVVLSNGVATGGFFSDDGRYYIFGDYDQMLNQSQSLIVADLGASPPAVVYEMQNGAFDGLDVTINGVLYFTALSSATPSVQTLYSVPFAGLTTSTKPATVTTRVATMTTSADASALYYLTTGGDIFMQPVDTSGAKGSPTQITPASTGTPVAAAFAVEPCNSEPCRLAWTGADGSLHVTKGGTELYKTAAKTVDVGSTLSFTGDGNLYFFQNIKQQELRGILYFADLSGATSAATTTSTPTAVFGSVTGLTDTTYDSKATYLYDVVNITGSQFLAQTNLASAMSPFAPQFGPLVVSGSSQVSIATDVPFGEVRFGYALALLENGTADTSSNTRVTGAGSYSGTLSTSDLSGAATSVVATAGDVVAGGNYGWSDDSFTLVFIESTPTAGAPPFDSTTMNYTGTVHVFDAAGKTGDHPVTLTGASSNATATELSSIVSRSAFIASTSGVYYLTY